ncbi:AraC family transcriptional regulator [Nocardia sp. NPDC023988]|uniref:AraC family transcriptional regulator n=1 Tax=unclassified Nocardia TaxID=2637762 RepID=UPI0033FB7644
MVNGPTTIEFSTPESRGEEVDRWAALMEQTYFPLAFGPIRDAPVYGKVTSGALPGAADFSLTVLAGHNHQYLRTKTHVARAAEEYVLVSIQVAGEARLTQSGRSVLLEPGQMTILDGSLPSLWDEAVAFEQVLVQIPVGTLRERPGLSAVPIPAAVAIEPDSPAGVVATHPARSCAAIAFESGFASERHFYRVFARETGMTPGEYRLACGPARH